MSNRTTASAAYQRDAILTATPVGLVVMTLQGAVTRLERARRAAAGNDKQVARSELNRARAIIAELFAALDREQGGEIAEQLAALYDFMLARLLAPSANLDVEGVAVAQQLLKKILEGFEAVLKSGSESGGDIV